MTVFVLGNATLDLVQEVERLPLAGETLLSRSVLRCAGGKGLNQAVAAARCGVPTVLIAPLGRDRQAERLRAAVLDEPGLTARWIACDAETDLSVIWSANGGQNMIVSSAEAARSVTPDQASAALAGFATGDFLVVQGNLRRETTATALELAIRRGGTTLLNTAPIAYDHRALLPLCSILVANEVEVLQLTGVPPAAALRRLRSERTRTIMVTLGGAGALLLDGDHEVGIEAPAVTPVDTGGAGDVAVGTLVAEIAAGRAIEAAARLAVGAASLSVTRRGTTPSFPTVAEIASLRAALAGSAA